MIATAEYRALFEDVSILPALALPALILGVPGIMMLCFFWWRRSRAREVAAVAERAGFRFRAGHDPKAQGRVPQFAPRQMRLGREGYNTASGVVTVRGKAADACFGDCTAIVRGLQKPNDPGASPADFTSYVAIRLPWPAVPELVLRHDGRRQDAPHGARLERVDFESDQFNRCYDVYTSSRRFAYDLIDPAMMEFLLKVAAPPVTIEGGWLMVEGLPGMRRWSARAFEDALAWATEFINRWPGHVVAEFEGLTAGELPGPRRY